MGIAALQKWGAIPFRFLSDPGGIPYLANPGPSATAPAVAAAPAIVGMFDPEAERKETSAEGIMDVTVDYPCLKVWGGDVAFSPNRGDLFVAQGQVWIVEATESAGLGGIYCWSSLAAFLPGGLIAPLPESDQ